MAEPVPDESKVRERRVAAAQMLGHTTAPVDERHPAPAINTSVERQPGSTSKALDYAAILAAGDA